MRSFHKAGIHPHILRTARAESIVSAVEIGEGISLLTESSYQLFHQPALVSIPINGLDKLSIGIAHKKYDSHLIGRMFSAICRES